MAIGGKDVLNLLVKADTKDASREFKTLGKTADSELSGIEKKSATFGKKTSANIKNAFSGALTAFASSGNAQAAVAGGFAIAAASVIKAGSDLNEQMSKTDAVFGSSSKEIHKWAEGAAKDFGQSRTQALEAASSFGNMFLQLGIGADVATDMSMNMTELASDFASFFNTNPAEAIDAISSAFHGEYDAVQRFVPTINAAAVQQKALSMGLAASTKELTEQDKALAAYQLIMEGAGQATGDFDRTSDSLANSTRIMQAQFSDLQAELGNALLPTIAEVAAGFSNIIAAADKLTGPLGGIGNTLGTIVKNTPLIGGLSNLGTVFEDGASGVDRFGGAVGFVIPVLGNLIQGLDGVKVKATAAVSGLVQIGAVLPEAFTAGTVNAGGFGRALDTAALATARATMSADAYARSMTGETAALQAANDALAANTNAKLAAIDSTFAVTAATNSFITANEGASTAVDDVKTGVNEQQVAIDGATQAAITAAGATLKYAEDQAKLEGKTLSAKDSQASLIGTLMKLASQSSGPVAAAIGTVITKLQTVGAQHPNPTLSANDQATPKIGTLRAHLAALNGSSATVNINANTAAARQALNSFYASIRSVNINTGASRVFQEGGPVPGGVNTPVPIIAHGGEYVLSADVVDRIKRGDTSRGASASLSLPGTGGGGGGATVVNFNGTFLTSKAELGRMVDEALAESRRRGNRAA